MSTENKSNMMCSPKGKEIPSKRILINDPSQMPMDYSTTPGGSIFSTTPGGTRIFYERSFLLKCRNSPLAKSPPANMAKIPGVTMPGEIDIPCDYRPSIEEEKVKENEEPQFQMDI